MGECAQLLQRVDFQGPPASCFFDGYFKGCPGDEVSERGSWRFGVKDDAGWGLEAGCVTRIGRRMWVNFCMGTVVGLQSLDIGADQQRVAMQNLPCV